MVGENENEWQKPNCQCALDAAQVLRDAFALTYPPFQRHHWEAHTRAVAYLEKIGGRDQSFSTVGNQVLSGYFRALFAGLIPDAMDKINDRKKAEVAKKEAMRQELYDSARVLVSEGLLRVMPLEKAAAAGARRT